MAHDRQQIPAIIFGDYITAFGVIRGLRKHKVPIYLVSKTGNGIATKSKYIKGVAALNPHHENFVDDLNAWFDAEIGEEAVLMIAGDDHYLDVLSRARGTLRPEMRFTFPEWDAVKKLRKKSCCYEIAEKLNIPMPRTFLVRSIEELREILKHKKSEFKYPLFLKAEDSSSLLADYGTKGVVCYKDEEVLESYKKYDGFYGELLLQEHMIAEEEKIMAVLMSVNANGDPTGLLINKKVRAEAEFLSSALSASSWSDDLLQYSLRIVKEIGYCGYAGVQFKLDERDGEYKFLEINGRFSLSNSLALRCGINLVYLIYQEAITGSVLPLQKFEQNYKTKVLWWNPLGDVKAIKNLALYKHPLRYIWSLIGRGYIIEPFSWRDPKPGLYALRRELGRLIARWR